MIIFRCSSQHLQVDWVYIDVWLHPVRFLDDNFFAFRSNDKLINDKLSNFQIDEDVYYLYADRVKIQSYMGWNKENIDKKLVDNSALFIGQTLTDKAVCRKGKMLNLLDFKDEFLELCNKYSHVYYSPHPMLKGDGGEIERFVKSCKNASVIREEGYKLLTSSSIKKVVAISSSLVYEAKFFGKDTNYFYTPVVDCNFKNSIKPYYSVYEDFISPHFWTNILSEALDLNGSTKVIKFIENKSKIRDMLSLYYNSHVFDKTDYIYKRQSSISNKGSINVNKSKKMESYYFVPNKIGVEKFKEKIKSVDVVSFDIFDTLIERPFSRPSVMFDLMKHKVAGILGDDVSSFKQARLNAKNLVDTSLYNEEVSLSLRYKALCEEYNLNGKASELENIELSEELRHCYQKKIGYELYKIALAEGKKVIYITDIFFESSFLRKLLKINGYNSNFNLYNSNDIGLLKHTGNIYPVVLSDLKVAPEKICHVGDNKRSDIEKAAEHGIQTFFVDTSVNLLKSMSPIVGATTYRDKNYESVVHALQAKNLVKDSMITNQHGFVAGQPYNLGYSVVGQMFFAMANWMIDKLSNEKSSKIYFLARDGEILKRSYDAIKKQYDLELPESCYLLASRRSIRVSNLITKEAVINEFNNLKADLKDGSDASSISSLLKARFGIDRVENSKYNELLKLPASRSNMRIIRKIVFNKDVLQSIVKNAQIERENLIKYYNEQGLTSGETIHFVDIGHHGSLQKGICDLLGIKSSIGYYFATYEKVDSILEYKSHKSYGFLRDRFPVADRNDSYIKYALIFETLFLNSQYSFLRMNDVDGKLIPEYLLFGEDKERINFSRKLHSGVEDFCSDMAKVFGPNLTSININPNESINTFISFLENPNFRDVIVFEGVCMENYYSGRNVRYIVPPKGVVSRDGIWRQGTLLKFKMSSDKNPSVEKDKLLVSGNNSLYVKLMKTVLKGKYPKYKKKFKEINSKVFN